MSCCIKPFQHEVRLKREGYDNVENIAEANPIEMAVRTGFSYSQLKSWVGEAWLRTQFGLDYNTLFRDTGVRTAYQLKLFKDKPELLVTETNQKRIQDKISCVTELLHDWDPTHFSSDNNAIEL